MTLCTVESTGVAVDPDTTRTRYEFEMRDFENKVQSDENYGFLCVFHSIRVSIISASLIPLLFPAHS